MCSWYGRRRGWWFVLGLPFLLIFLAAGGLVLMLLWNALIPAIFGLKAITYLQALGLLVLARILFGGFRGRPRPFYSRQRHWEHWKKWHEEESEDSPRPESSAGPQSGKRE